MTIKVSNQSQRLVECVNAGTRGVFGITRRDQDHQLYLVTQQRWLPIIQFRLWLSKAGDTPLEASESDFSWSAVLAQDDGKHGAELAVFDSTSTILSSEEDSLTGYVFIVAGQKHQGTQIPYAVLALFDSSGGLVTADGEPELVRQWTMATRLMEGLRHAH